MDILFVTYALNGLLMIAIPIGLVIFLTRRWKMGWRIWWIGVATFVLSQVGHIPFNALVGNLLNNTGMVYWSPLAQRIFNALFLGLSAGLFEEGARYLILRFWAKDARSWRNGVLFGAGHGGAEAIIFGVLVLVSYISLLSMRNADLASIVPASQLDLARQQVDAYWSAPWYATLMGALERFFTIPIQIAMASLVMRAFIRKNISWLFLAVGYHAVVDASAVLLINYVGTYWLEAIVCGFSILSVIVIFRLRQPKPPVDPEPVPASPPSPFTPKSVEETKENLDKTRFH